MRRQQSPRSKGRAALLLGATVLFGHPGTATAATCAEEYCYDSLGRLQVALLCGTEYRYRYDAAGNLIERTVAAGTPPLVCDADSDGLADLAETATGTFVSLSNTGTDPFHADTDGDALADGVETNTSVFVSASDTGTNPHVADSDGDGVSDGAEVAAGTDPNNAPPKVPGLSRLGLALLTGLLLVGGGLLAWRVRRARGLAAALLLALPSLALSGTSARAAVCGPGTVTLGVGETKHSEIRAAAADELSGPTSYTVASNTAPATVSPAIQSTARLVRFQITGTSPGSGTAQFDWSAPSGNSGSCTVNIDVVATPPPPSSANNHDAPRRAGVDLFTGERLVGPWGLLNLRGPLPLGLAVSYASARVRDGQLASSLGDGWRHNFEARLFTAGSETRVALPSGRTLRFSESGGSYTLLGPLETPYQLVADGADHVLLHPWSHLRYRFNAAGQLVAIFDRNGNTLTLTYDGELLSQVSDGLGRVLTFSYDANHFLAQVGDGTRTVSFSVSTQRQLTQATDAEGNATGFAYSNAVADTPSLLTVITLADGSVRYTVAYSGSARVTSRTAASVPSGGTGGTVSIALAGSTVTLTDEAGEVWTFSLDAEGNLLSVVDPNGDTATWNYDAKGRPTGFVDAEGRSWSLAYEATGGAVSQVNRPDAAARTVSFATVADALGLIDVDANSWVDFDGTSGSVVRNATGNVTSVTDAAGQTWTFTYNAAGQLLTATSPTSVVVSFTYNADGTLASATDGAGNITTLVYDVLKRLLQVDHPDATNYQQVLDGNDLLTDLTDALGQVTQIGRDQLGRAALVIDPALGNWETFYNTMGVPNGNLDPLGNGSNVGYDQRELLVVVDDATSRTTQFGYDAPGNATSRTDNAGQTQTTAVNNVGVPTSRTNRLGDTWTYVRNLLDQLLQLQSPLGLTQQRTVDARGRTTSVTGPAGRTWTLVRDARGLVQTVIGPDGSQFTIARNAAGQITGITDANGNDWLRNLDAAGRSQSFANPLGNTTTQSHDTRNRVNQRTFPGGLGTETRSFNANGQLTQRTFSDGTTHNYAFDTNGWLVGASGVALTRDAAGRISVSNGITTTPDAAGRTVQIEYGPGFWVQFSYDANGLLQTVTDWTDPLNPAIVISRDLEGRIVSIVRANGTSTTMTYDADGRLTSLQHFGPGATLIAEVTIVYGADGRPKSKTRTGAVVDPGSPLGTQSISRNAASLPTSVNGSPIVHDAMGKRTLGPPPDAYTSRLDRTPASMTVGAATLHFQNDACGFPTEFTVGADTTQLTWNYGTRRPTLAAIDQGPNVQLNVVDPQTSMRLYALDPFTNARTFVHPDESGHARDWTNPAGNVVLSQAYSPDGQNVASVGNPGASGLVPVGFLAEYGVMTLDNRFLLPGSGLFDPVTGNWAISTNQFRGCVPLGSPGICCEEPGLLPVSSFAESPCFVREPQAAIADPSCLVTEPGDWLRAAAAWIGNNSNSNTFQGDFPGVLCKDDDPFPGFPPPGLPPGPKPAAPLIHGPTDTSCSGGRPYRYNWKYTSGIRR